MKNSMKGVDADRQCDCCGGPHFDYDEHHLICDPCNPNIPDLNPRSEDELQAIRICYGLIEINEIKQQE
jgi:hypothetical protein